MAEGDEAVKLFARVWPYRRAVVIGAVAVFTVVAGTYAAYQRFLRTEEGHAALEKKYEEHTKDSVTRKEHDSLVVRVEREERVNQEQGTSLAVINERLDSLADAVSSVKYGVDLLVKDRLEKGSGVGSAGKGEAKK